MIFAVLWRALVHPAVGLPLVFHRASLGQSLSWLFVAGLIAWSGTEFRQFQRFGERRAERQTVVDIAVSIVSAAALLFPGSATLLTFVTTLIAEGLRLHAGFESLFGVIVVVCLPRLLGVGILPIRGTNRWCFQVYRAVPVVLSAWCAAALWIGLRATFPHTAIWRVALLTLPVSVCLGLIAFLEAKSESSGNLRTVAFWKRSSGERCHVYHSGARDELEMRKLAEACDRLIERAGAVLEVEPLRFKVGVFVFDTAEAHAEAIGKHYWERAAYSHGDGISILYGPWQECEGMVAHEFGHVYRYQRIARSVPALLDEGLAEYVAGRIAPDGAIHPPKIGFGEPLAAMANEAFFRIAIYSNAPMLQPWRSDVNKGRYSGAHSLAKYLIETEGIEKYKQLCRAFEKTQPDDYPAALDTSVRQVYGYPLEVLEKDWRSGQGHLVFSDEEPPLLGETG